MAQQKIYAGARLRETRLAKGMTQRGFAQAVGVSVSYLNQMERNNRPVSAGVMLKLVQEFGFDIRTLSADESDRLVADLTEAVADPAFGSIPVQEADLRLMATNAPGLARSVLSLYRTHREMSERFAALDEALGELGHDSAATPWEEVRDFFHYCGNYVDAVDRSAEHFAASAGFEGAGKLAAGARWLEERHGVTVSLGDGPIRRLDAQAGVLHLGRQGGGETAAFQLAHQVALMGYADLIDATLDLADFSTVEARAVARIGLANYFAGAAILPYERFLGTAARLRHDLDALALEFGASYEQIAHRLSTMQRPGAKGVPFFFVRVDQAGTITKRHSATRLQFARYGAACPLWNVHRAFEAPGQWLRQLAETPDGTRYLCLAREVSKPAVSFRAPTRRYAIGLGCETRHAGEVIYADDLDLTRAAAFEPIGVSCRICERQDCHQRSVPPMKHAIEVDHDRREELPYGFGAPGKS